MYQQAHSKLFYACDKQHQYWKRHGWYWNIKYVSLILYPSSFPVSSFFAPCSYPTSSQWFHWLLSFSFTSLHIFLSPLYLNLIFSRALLNEEGEFEVLEFEKAMRKMVSRKRDCQPWLPWIIREEIGDSSGCATRLRRWHVAIDLLSHVFEPLIMLLTFLFLLVLVFIIPVVFTSCSSWCWLFLW